MFIIYFNYVSICSHNINGKTLSLKGCVLSLSFCFHFFCFAAVVDVVNSICFATDVSVVNLHRNCLFRLNFVAFLIYDSDIIGNNAVYIYTDSFHCIRYILFRNYSDTNLSAIF